LKTGFKKILFTVNPIDLNSMESLDIILGDLQDMHTNIDLYAINSDVNALFGELFRIRSCVIPQFVHTRNPLAILIDGLVQHLATVFKSCRSSTTTVIAST